MRVLILFAHPVETSFHAALQQATIAALTDAGHEIDTCNLYEEGFDPVLSRDERLCYHTIDANQKNVRSHVQRLQKADALVIIAPIWNFGFPAILKGYFDRVFLPGVSFTLERGKGVPKLRNIRKCTIITTYGGSRLRALLMGDPPRTFAKRVLKATFGLKSPLHYLALYDMNRAPYQTRTAFLARVSTHMRRF